MLLLRNQPGSFTWTILKASCILEFEGENKREGHCQSLRDTEELFRKQILSCCLYWGIKVKTITERYCFVILTYLFFLFCIYGFISPQFYQRIGPMFTDSTEGSIKAETEIHGNSLWLCVSKPQALKEIENVYRMTESNKISLNILENTDRLPIWSRAVSWSGGRVDENSGVFGRLCGVCLLVAFWG